MGFPLVLLFLVDKVLDDVLVGVLLIEELGFYLLKQTFLQFRF